MPEVIGQKPFPEESASDNPQLRGTIPPENWARICKALDESGPKIYNTVLRWTNGDSNLAEDIIQEMTIKAARRVHSFKEEGLGLDPWLITIARHLYIDICRRKQRFPYGKQNHSEQQEILVETPSLCDEIGQAATEIALNEMLLTIRKIVGQEFFDAFYTCNVLGFKYIEYANLIGVTLGTVRSRVHRGKERIKKIIKEDPEFQKLLTSSEPTSQRLFYET